jgi:hypothetical protein
MPEFLIINIFKIAIHFYLIVLQISFCTHTLKIGISSLSLECFLVFFTLQQKLGQIAL